MSIHKVSETKTVAINDAEARDDLRKLHGLPPYDGGGNPCYGDGYFARSLVEKYGMELDKLKMVVGFNAELVRWKQARAGFMASQR